MSSRTRLIGAERYVIEITEFALQVFHHGTVTYLRRQVSLPTHGAIAVLLGMVIFLAPAFLHFQVAGLILTATLGAIEIGLGLTFIAPGRYATAACNEDFLPHTKARRHLSSPRRNGPPYGGPFSPGTLRAEAVGRLRDFRNRGLRPA